MPRVTIPQWDERYAALSMCVGAYFAVRLAQLLVSPLVPSLQGTFGVSRGTIGVILTGMWLVYACSQVPSGAAGDRYGPRRVVLLALGCTTAAALALAAAPSALTFGAFALLLGVGAGLYYTPATALLADRFDDVGRVIGVHRVGSQVAGLVAPALAALVGARFGWRVAVGSGALVAAVCLGVALWRGPTAVTPRRRPATDGGAAVRPHALVGVLTRPPVAFSAALAAIGEFAALATLSFLPAFLVEHYGLSLSAAGALFGAYFVVVAALQPVSGWASDRFGRDTVTGALFTAGAVGYTALAVGGELALAVPAVALVGVAMAWGPPVQSRAVDALADAERGVGFGAVRTAYILVGALGPAVVGTLADTAGWTAGFGLLAGVLGLGAVALVLSHLVEPKQRLRGSYWRL
ncbi:MFS transporter [Haloplanus aerogenes]|uniref:MFS transporter n=1 Tax=Haloplanus aerogenes TaxID=660522 RepID=A0A3M0D1U1_9EURY|nr:MFS transporter [Haloplanus aerogenes]AZH27103.1 MFS transporter [Haloplanus aerogenes]RMB13396.1 sugar phosphate permease [Haloplanus aerogenes]